MREVALADSPGTLPFYDLEHDPGLSSFAPENPSGATVRDVEVTTLDEIAPDATFVKLDLDGSEVRALRGATRLLEDTRPDMLLEVENGHLERQGTSLSDLQSLLTRFDYDVYTITFVADRMITAPLGSDWKTAKRSRDLLARPKG